MDFKQLKADLHELLVGWCLYENAYYGGSTSKLLEAEPEKKEFYERVLSTLAELDRYDPLDEVVTAAEADIVFDKGEGVTRVFCNQEKFKRARKSGKTWLVTKTECRSVYKDFSETEPVTESKRVTETELVTESKRVTETELVTESKRVTESKQVTQAEPVTESKQGYTEYLVEDIFPPVGKLDQTKTFYHAGNREKVRYELDWSIQKTDEKPLYSALASKRGTVHVLDPEHLGAICGSKSIAYLPTAGYRSSDQITCTHCLKWYKLK